MLLHSKSLFYSCGRRSEVLLLFLSIFFFLSSSWRNTVPVSSLFASMVRSLVRRRVNIIRCSFYVYTMMEYKRVCQGLHMLYAKISIVLLLFKSNPLSHVLPKYLLAYPGVHKSKYATLQWFCFCHRINLRIMFSKSSQVDQSTHSQTS